MNTCHDCGCKEGEMHEKNCDMEICPRCKGQLLSCGCNQEEIDKFEKEPYFFKGFSCPRCGKFFPDMKMVTDRIWKKIIGITYQQEDAICLECMDFIIEKRGLK